MLLPLTDHPASRVALRHNDLALTYGELLACASAHAHALHAMGLRVGDRVAVWASIEVATVVSLVANALAGFVSVPINPSVGDAELAHVLADAAPRVLVGRPERAVSTPLVDVDLVGASGHVPSAPAATAPALVLYTSGTTGRPKGAVLSHGAIAANLDALARAWRWTDDDALVHALPLFHVHGLALGLFGTLRRGATLDLLPRFEAASVIASLTRGATMVFGVPTMYHRLVEHAERAPAAATAMARARLLVSGSAGLPLREHRRIEAVTGRGVLERYGLTETLINTALGVDDGPRPGSVGRPLDGVSLRLVDDARVTLDAHDDATLGEVAVRGANLFDGYLNRPDATAAVRDGEGWFYTGDLATRARDGALRIVGRRATDLIKTGGYKVGAGEIEAALLEHPAVLEAAVRGVDDDDLGERIEAWVALREGQRVPPEVLADHVAASLAWHKRPRRVHVVAALPRNAMGKVMKTALGGDPPR
jgi:malonyl-CoA/methylmalonyl-CoA synthetase